ncbi:MAG: DUF1476 domain-containing protein [Rhodospirillaceae bacterium]|jgi:hypothetical protein|nr:DUF1476 domain-containing protein [Rhodospirillaceae bacterium]
MSDAFEDRGKSYEAKYKQDQELAFKVQARRNKLLGLWLAGKFSIEGEAAAAYAKDVVIADLDEPGDEDVIRKVMADIAEHGVDISEDTIREQLETLESAAFEQVKLEFPEALSGDHQGTAG